jgi:hypothetical protein
MSFLTCCSVLRKSTSLPPNAIPHNRPHLQSSTACHLSLQALAFCLLYSLHPRLSKISSRNLWYTS